MAAVAICATILLAVTLLYPLLVRRFESKIKKRENIQPSDDAARPSRSVVGGAVANIMLFQFFYVIFLWRHAILDGSSLSYFVVFISTALKTVALFRTWRVMSYSILAPPQGYNSFYAFFFWSYILLPVSLAFDVAAFSWLASQQIH